MGHPEGYRGEIIMRCDLRIDFPWPARYPDGDAREAHSILSEVYSLWLINPAAARDLAAQARVMQEFYPDGMLRGLALLRGADA